MKTMSKGTWLGKKHSWVVEHRWGSGNSLHESESHSVSSISRTQKTWGSEKIRLSSITKGSHSLELWVSPCKRISPHRWRCHLPVQSLLAFYFLLILTSFISWGYDVPPQLQLAITGDFCMVHIWTPSKNGCCREHAPYILDNSCSWPCYLTSIHSL